MHGSCRTNCSNPLDATVLADYWLGALAEPEEETVEEHLLDCDRCGTRLREVIALTGGLRTLAREGSLRMARSSLLDAGGAPGAAGDAFGDFRIGYGLIAGCPRPPRFAASR